MNSTRGHSFAEAVIQRVNSDSGYAARLKMADSEITGFRAFEHLSRWCELSNDDEFASFATIAAAIARAKPKRNGFVGIGRALAMCFDDGCSSTAAKARLLSLLMCRTVESTTKTLRHILMFINSKGGFCFDYGALLDDLLRFGKDGDSVHRKWATDFYGTRRLI